VFDVERSGRFDFVAVEVVQPDLQYHDTKVLHPQISTTCGVQSEWRCANIGSSKQLSHLTLHSRKGIIYLLHT
jgi:hypothetical protein